MKSVDETIGRLHPTLRAILALGSAVVFGAVLNNVFQSYIGIPAELEKMRVDQHARDSVQDIAIRTNELETRQVRAVIEGAGLRDLAGAVEDLFGAVEELVIQICEDRADRSGVLTTARSRECRRQAQQLDPGGGGR